MASPSATVTSSSSAGWTLAKSASAICRPLVARSSINPMRRRPPAAAARLFTWACLVVESEDPLRQRQERFAFARHDDAAAGAAEQRAAEAGLPAADLLPDLRLRSPQRLGRPAHAARAHRADEAAQGAGVDVPCRIPCHKPTLWQGQRDYYFFRRPRVASLAPPLARSRPWRAITLPLSRPASVSHRHPR